MIPCWGDGERQVLSEKLYLEIQFDPGMQSVAEHKGLSRDIITYTRKGDDH